MKSSAEPKTVVKALLAGPVLWMAGLTLIAFYLTLRSAFLREFEFGSSVVQPFASVIAIGAALTAISAVFGPPLHMFLRERGWCGLIGYLVSGILIGTLAGTALSNIVLPYMEIWDRALDIRPFAIAGGLFGGTSALLGWLIRRPDCDPR